MSWYTKDNPNISVDNLMQSGNNYIQVPSSSPIKISTPPTNHELQPTSLRTINQQQQQQQQQQQSNMTLGLSNMVSEHEKQRMLEMKRDAIRNHPDYPIIRKRFFYLNESDIFKGFIKGRGNLRDVSTWLTENYNRDEMLARLNQEQHLLQQQRQQEEYFRKQEMFERMKQDYEYKIANGIDVMNQQHQVQIPPQIPQNLQIYPHQVPQNLIPQNQYHPQHQHLQQPQNYQVQQPQHHQVQQPQHQQLPQFQPQQLQIPHTLPNLEIYHEENESPIKGRARSKSIISSQNYPEKPFSTKVEVKKKISILDKYKFKPKQTNFDNFRPFQANNQPKKRKLVRLSSLNDSSSTSTTPEPYNNNAPMIPNLQFRNYNPGYPQQQQFQQQYQQQYFQQQYQQQQPQNFVNDDIDELERLEQKIRQNRRKKNSRNISDDDDILDDDNDSDSMSEEEDKNGYNGGLTANDTRVREFINNAPKQELIEICNIEPAVADLIIDQRPFNSIYEISENDFPLPDETPKPKSRKRKTLGLRIVESTSNSLKGYKAVDSLIKTCSEYGNAISKQIAEWGVTITGEGELDLVELDPVNDEVKVEPINNDDGTGDEPEENSVEEVTESNGKNKGLKYIKHKPALMSGDITLNNYQQVGLNWLNLLYRNKLSCILADEMGLGKTCQVISFMAHLKQTQPKKGPHLVVVPASTIENWMREFNKFCPDIVVQAYYGTMREREDLRIELKGRDYDVLVTTYSLAAGSSADVKFLRNLSFDIIVYDEGHFLKNSGTDRYAKLMRMSARFRLLLTGTPLQNNLKELVSLLSFMLPKLFNDKKEDLQGLFNQKMGTVTSSSSSKPTTHNPLLVQQAIDRAKTMMTPFVLRRKKCQVLQHLPAKCHEIIDCTLTEVQKTIYDEEVQKAKATRAERERRKLITDKAELEKLKNDPIPSSTNVLMALRKASLHPLLFRVIYDDKKLKKMAKAIREEPEYVEANETFIFEDMQVMSDYELNNLCEKFPTTLRKYKLKDDDFLASGKVTEFVKLIKTIIEDRKEKVLVFSLFTQVLDILEKVLSIIKYKFVRLDGATSVETRQDIIDSFYEEEDIPIFLLSTKAGGFGINLVAANNVIIFDQSFNPHDDKQAEDRAHRVGQKKEVTVYKLIVKDNIEQNILHLAENKLQLDQSISADDAGNDNKFEEKTASLFERLLL
jgi:SWI/SNF-related matrix-associated actin-dependent regulator 1 of chromatin subfamily A